MTGPGAVRAALAGLLVLDTTLAVVAFGFPELWFQVFHGVPYSDPQGLLRRTGAAWAAFALFQALALGRWEADPRWLGVAAGLRFGDVFTDWTYLAFAPDLTPFAWGALLGASPANLALGLFFFRRAPRGRIRG